MQGVIRRLRPVRSRPELIFVLGSQRSGTNALRQSLSLDPYVMGFNERKSSELYAGWKLRPEPEIRDFLLDCAPHKVLLKPIQSVFKTPVADFLAPFGDYSVKVAWIYRDPVAVFRSRSARWTDRNDTARFVNEWNRINNSALDANDPRIGVVCYDRLLEDGASFRALGKFLGVRGDNLFRPTRTKAQILDEVGEAEGAEIGEQTRATMARLDAAAAALLETHGRGLAPEEPTSSDDLVLDDQSAETPAQA